LKEFVLAVVVVLPSYMLKPVFHSRISPPLAKNFATEKVHLLFFRAVNERSNRS
jgi:hypothetical protein